MSSAILIRETRLRHGLSQASLARRSRTSQTHISRLERGEVSPSVDTLGRILTTMGQQLELSATPGPAGNQSDAEVRAEARLTPTEALVQAAELSYVLTSLAAARDR